MWSGKMGTRICPFYHWENWIWASGNMRIANKNWEWDRDLGKNSWKMIFGPSLV